MGTSIWIFFKGITVFFLGVMGTGECGPSGHGPQPGSKALARPLESVLGVSKEKTQPAQSSIQLLPLLSITVKIIHRASGQSQERTIPLGYDLQLERLRIRPTSCQAVQKKTQSSFSYRAVLTIYEDQKQNQGRDLFLTTEEGYPRYTIVHPVYSVFLIGCTFADN